MVTKRFKSLKWALKSMLIKGNDHLRARGLALIISLCTYSALASTQTGIFAYQNNDYTLARELLSVEVYANPNDDKIHHYLGRIAYLQGELEQAEAYFSKAIELNDQNAENFYWLAVTLSGQFSTVSIFNTFSLVDHFLGAAKQAVILSPNSLLAHEGLLKFYVSAPSILGGSIKLAKKHAKIIAQLDTAAGHYAYGRIHYKKGELKQAEQQIRFALALKPQRIKYNFGLGLLLSNTERELEAIEVFSGVSKLKAAGPFERINIWLSMDKVGELSALSGKKLALGEYAIKTYLTRNVVHSTLSEKSWAKSRLATIYQHQGKNSQAVQLLNEILKNNSDKKLNKHIKKQLLKLKSVIASTHNF
jgi:tetratricopeptide (TPR) repeat protein